MARSRLTWLAAVAILVAAGGAPAVNAAAAAVLIPDPTHGIPSQDFSVAYNAPDAQCEGLSAGLWWDEISLPSEPLTADCGATWSFAEAPDPAIGPHKLSACIIDKDRCVAWSASNVYTVDPPPPSLVLNPSRGRVTRAITATYFLATCGRAQAATFFWNGTRVRLGDVPFEPDCHAAMTFRPPRGTRPGRYTVSAEVCDATCDLATRAQAGYMVLAPPPPSPTATPVSEPVATPTLSPEPTLEPTPVPTPTATPTMGPTPTAAASPTDTAAGHATASPTGAVLGAAGTPGPATPPGGPIRPAGPTNPFLPALAASVKGPESLNPTIDVTVTNLVATIVFVFLFGLTAEVFNGTMDSNRTEIEGMWRRLRSGPLRFLGPVFGLDARLDRLSSSGRIGLFIHALLVLALVGVIYGFLSPDFGLNGPSVVLFLSLAAGLGFVTYFTEGFTTLLARRRYRLGASVQLYGTAVLVAVVSVIASRFIEFTPGLVYGFIASSVIMAPVALARRDDAILVLVPALGLLAISVAAWLLLQPARAVGGDGGWLGALVDSILATIVVAGLEGLFFTMIPLRFMDGAVVMRWSRPGWALFFGSVTFLWWQLLLNQNAAYAAAFRQTSVQLVIAMLALFMLTTGGLWTFFRLRAGRAEAVASA